MGKLSGEKGKRWERKFAEIFRDALGLAAKRGRQDRGAEAADVECAFVWPECKHSGVGVETALKQAEQNQADNDTTGRVPIAVVKRHRQADLDAIVAMRLSTFLRLMRLALPAWEKERDRDG